MLVLALFHEHRKVVKHLNQQSRAEDWNIMKLEDRDPRLQMSLIKTGVAVFFFECNF